MSTTVNGGDASPDASNGFAMVEVAPISSPTTSRDDEGTNSTVPKLPDWSHGDPLEIKKQRIDDSIDKLTAAILELAWPQRFQLPRDAFNSDSQSVNASISEAESMSIVQHSMQRLAAVQNKLIDATRTIQLETAKEAQAATGTSATPTSAIVVPGFLVPEDLSPEFYPGVAFAHKLLPAKWLALFFRHMAVLNLFHDAVTGLGLGVAFLVLLNVIPVEWVWFTFIIHIIIEAPYLFLLLNVDLAKRLLLQFDVLYLCLNWIVINCFCLPDLFGWDIRSLIGFANAPTAILNLLGDASAGEVTRKHHKLRTILISGVLLVASIGIRMDLFTDIVPRSIDIRWLEIRTDALFVTCATNIIVFSLRFVYNIWRHPQSLLTLKINVERSDLGRSASIQRWKEKMREHQQIQL